MKAVGFLLSGSEGKRAFVISPEGRTDARAEKAARARFKEWFGTKADRKWDEAFEWPHYVITADDYRDKKKRRAR